jgi:hypothetical protein
MATPTRDLSGVRLKLGRAKEHIGAVRAKTLAFTEREPPPFGFRTERTERADETVEYVLYAIVRDQPPHDLAPMIGDVLHNTRSALDHLVYELAPPRVRRRVNTQFPIFTDECRYRVLGEPKIAGISGDERALIERVQPWNASSQPDRDPLAILNRLSNLDKHRLLIPFIATVNRTEVWVGSTNADIDFSYIELGAVEHDAKIFAFTARPTDASKEMHVQPRSGLHIQLSDTGMENIGLVDLLEVLVHHVEHTVIDSWFRYGFLPPTWAEVNSTQ